MPNTPSLPILVVTMDKQTRYQELDAASITRTIETLSNRIDERFPDSGLHRLSQKLLTISRRAEEQADWIARPIIPLRIGIAILVGFILLGIVGTLAAISTPIKEITLIEFVQVLEAGINDVVLISIAIYFLITLERRFKRHRALTVIHELRAIAHIIDMHQLTKDPGRLQWESKGMVEPRTAMTPFQLTRYLDYCSEMLSLVGKISVLYVQHFDDPIALTAVNEVENLTTGLSRKIWQKLMIVHEGGLHLDES